MPRELLGELEHLVLLAILRRGSDAYGAAIIDEVETQTGRELAHAAVYIALRRLEGKGLIASRTMKGTTERGGRAKAAFVVTAAGRARLRDSAAALFTMWDGVDPALRQRGRS